MTAESNNSKQPSVNYNDPFLDEFLKKSTPKLKGLTQHYFQTLSTKEFREYVENLKQFTDEVKRNLLNQPAGPKRARELHRLIETDIYSHQKIKPTCHKGCGSCCHVEIEVTPDEAALLAEKIFRGHSINRARLNLQSLRPPQSREWGRGAHEYNRCVFLGDDQACTAYDERPSACRKHLVTSPPLECKTRFGKPSVVLLPYSEAIISTALQLLTGPAIQFATAVRAELTRLEDKAIRTKSNAIALAMEGLPPSSRATRFNDQSKINSEDPNAADLDALFSVMDDGADFSSEKNEPQV
jgi:Fe-S-cluster containining protein